MIRRVSSSNISRYRSTKNQELYIDILIENISSQKILNLLIKTDTYENMNVFSFKAEDFSLTPLKQDDKVDYKHSVDDDNTLLIALTGLDIVAAFVTPITPDKLVIPVIALADGVLGVCLHQLNNARVPLKDMHILVVTNHRMVEIEFERLTVNSASLQFMKSSDSSSSDSHSVKVLPAVPEKKRRG